MQYVAIEHHSWCYSNCVNHMACCDFSHTACLIVDPAVVGRGDVHNTAQPSGLSSSQVVYKAIEHLAGGDSVED